MSAARRSDPGEQTGVQAATELLRRIQAETRRTSRFGGWPPPDRLPGLLREWFADYGLDPDDRVPDDG